MRQVPKYLIIGNGRVARHFVHYFSLLKIKQYSQWDRSQPVARLKELVDDSNRILLAIRDDAIEPFIDEHLSTAKVCEHVQALNQGYAALQTGASADTVRDMERALKFFAGSHGDLPANRKNIANAGKALEVLPGAGEAGVRRLGLKIDAIKKGLRAPIRIHFSGSLVSKKAWGAHPLMTFGPDLYPLEKYLSIPFVVDEKAPPFSELFPSLHNPNVRLNERQKAKYHALCVMSGNFSCLLWQKLFESLSEEFGISPHTADMYLRQQADNLLANYKTALTGPLARGDQATIAKNLKALDHDPFQGIYQAFVEAWPSIKQEKLKDRERKAS
ncbi:MAG: DUF2520 domain-containing protein [Alphaproteobacteria bacterium]|nr:MAG: DUF2520 domain-containing protein [Alphaproteobacteria bacterium]